MDKEKEHISVIFLGHVNSGKSTTVGSLSYKLGIPDNKCVAEERVEKEAAEMSHRSLKYSWVLGKLKAERERGTAIDVSYDKLQTSKYLFTVIDAPGNRDFISNAITGIFQADCVVLVIDCRPEAFEEGISKGGQTWEYLLLARALGVRQLICCCNKIDATVPQFSKLRYNQIVKDISPMVKKVRWNPLEVSFVPISGLEGDNIIERSTKLSWYEGPTLLEALNKISVPKRPTEKSLRFPVQDVYKVDGIGIILVGRVETGTLKPDMKVCFAPAEVTKPLIAEVKYVLRHCVPMKESIPGEIVEMHVTGVPMRELKRGFVASNSKGDRAWEAGSFTSLIHVLDQGICNGYEAVIHCHTSYSPVRFARILSTVDEERGLKEIEKEPDVLKKGDTALVLMTPLKPVVVETFSEYPPLGRFAVTDTGRLIAVGKVLKVDKFMATRKQTLQIELDEVNCKLRNLKVEIKLCRCDINKLGKNLTEVEMKPQLELIDGQIKGLMIEKKKRGTTKSKSASNRMIQDFVRQKEKLKSPSSSEIEDPTKLDAYLESAKQSLLAGELKLERLKGKKTRIEKEMQQLREPSWS